LAHSVANYLAAAESDLVTIVREVFFNFDYQFGVCEADAVACCGAV